MSLPLEEGSIETMTIIQLCRFDDKGELSLSLQDIISEEFIAISHVWGPESSIIYQEILGIPWLVPLSPQKATFISTQLFSLVQNKYFWMDVLSVDQKSEEARASVVKHIPQIYRKADYTLIIREQNGLQSCCGEIFEFGDCSKSESLEDYAARKWLQLNEHLKAEHAEGLQEVWLERNWPLQELFLSDSVRFTMCEQTGKQERLLGEGHMARVDVGPWQTSLVQTELENMARRWSGAVGQEVDDLVEYFSRLGRTVEDAVQENISEIQNRQSVAKQFLVALFSNSEVTRLPYSQPVPMLSSLVKDYINSTRRTGKPRDFILALFPQFQWYILPQNFKSLNFGNLFGDCMDQIQGIQSVEDSWQSVDEFRIRPKLTKGIINGFSVDAETSREAATNVPEPVSMGDFFKLMHIQDNTTLSEDDESLDFFWHISPVYGPDLTAKKLVSLLSDTLWYTDFTAVYAFLAQLAVENTNKSQLLQLLSGGDASHNWNPQILHPSQENLNSEHEKELNLVGHSLNTIEALGIIGNVLTIHNHLRMGPIFAQAQAMFSIMNPNLTSFEAQNLRGPGSAETELAWLESQVLSLEFADYEKTLYLAIALCCGFGLSSLPWLRDNLQLYALKRFGSQEDSVMETLVLASKGLDTEILDNEFTVRAYLDGWEPYVVAASESGESTEVRIIGLAPKKGDWSPNVMRFADDEV